MAPLTLIAQGTASDLLHLGQYEAVFAEGAEGRLDLELRLPAPASVVAALDAALRKAGIQQRVEAVGNSLRIHFRKTLAPLAIIAIAVAASIVLLALLVAWKLYQVSPAAVSSGFLILLLAGLAVVAFVLTRRGAT